MEVAKEQQDKLERIKENVRDSHDYFKHNCDRYNEFRRFVFESSLTPDELNLLITLGKPQLEFNILEAYISRLLGEFSKQQPDIMVSADDENSADPLTVNVLEANLRHTLCDASNHHTKYEVYKDLLSGGFSVLKVTTNYAHPMSFKQVINIDRAYDPTLCGFDKLARYSHKGDGKFCFECFPMEREVFKEENPDISIDKISFRRDFEGFNWSYTNDNTKILIVCDYYEKKIKKVEIVELSNGKVMTKSEYKKKIQNWDDFTAPPVIVGKPRKTEIETICRYRIIENCVIEYEETDFTYFPLIFVDGNSVIIKTKNNSNVRQFTRPYVYHAKSAQRLKNYAGISLANEIENIVQHKFIIKKEALPKEEEYLQAIKDIQTPSNIIINGYDEKDPSKPILEPIREIIKAPSPPEVLQGFTTTDSLIQQILGSYDASLGINDNQLSGVALVEAATQSNSAAMPYIVGYLQGYQRAAQVYVDLFPKYYTTPSTIPIMDKEGKRSFVKINSKDGVNMFYDSNALNVTVTAGASFQVQKSRTIIMLKEMMSMSPLFAQFISEKGLPFVLNNMEGKGIEQLKEMVDGWLQELQQQKQMEMQKQQQEMQNNPIVMKNQIAMQKLQQDGQKNQSQFMLDMAKLKQDENKILSDLQISKQSSQVQLVKAATERFAKQVDLKIKHKDMAHRHLREAINLNHNINKANQPREGT